MSLYDYANGDPVNFVDPDGRFFSSLFRSIGNLIKRAVRAVVRHIKKVVKLITKIVREYYRAIRSFVAENAQLFQISAVFLNFIPGVGQLLYAVANAAISAAVAYEAGGWSALGKSLAVSAVTFIVPGGGY